VAEEAGRGETSSDTAAILSRINHELARDNPSLIYVTAVLGRLDPATGDFDLANAGHPMPLLLDGRALSRSSRRRTACRSASTTTKPTRLTTPAYQPARRSFSTPTA